MTQQSAEDWLETFEPQLKAPGSLTSYHQSEALRQLVRNGGGGVATEEPADGTMNMISSMDTASG